MAITLAWMKRGRPVSFRPVEAVERWLEMAQAAGFDKTEVLNAVLTTAFDGSGISRIEAHVRVLMKRRGDFLSQRHVSFLYATGTERRTD